MQQIAFDPADPRAALAQLPQTSAVFALYGAEAHAEPYIGRTPNLRGRLERLLQPSARHPRRLQLAGRVRRIEWQLTGSEFESLLLQFELLQKVYGTKCLERMHLRSPAFVRFLGGNPYPRITVTHRPSQREADWSYGPFPSRAAAERYAEEMLKLFLLRRCTFELSPDPGYPGCVYSEMKMCLAPCFKGCSDEEYVAEVGRVQQFLESGGHSLVREIERQRDDASTSLDFEAAAALHTRLEKVKAAAAQLPDIVRRLDELNGVMVQPSAERESVALFKIVGGRICAPVALSVGQPAGAAQLVSKPQSMESRIAEALAAVEAPNLRRALEWMEHLALLKRWYYRTIKVGELFLADDGELPMRRVVRGVSRVFRGEKPAGDLSDTAGDYWKFRAREAGLTES